MAEVNVNEVHIGREIKNRFSASRMSKTEFGHQIGVSPQHINKIFEKESIDTERLSKICLALEFNFFSLYCDTPTHVSANLSAVSLGAGDAQNTIGSHAVTGELEIMKKELALSKTTEELLREQIEQLKSNLRDKEEIINLLKKEKI